MTRARRLAIVTLACLIGAVALGLVGTVVGSTGLGLPEVVRTLLGQGSGGDAFIVYELRLPRVGAALAVGAALGLAGALTQTFSRNPLATPDIIGVTSGASLGGVAAILLTGGTYAVTDTLLAFGVPLSAALGALLVATIVYGLSWRGGVQGFRLVLTGIGATAVCTGITNWLVAKAQITQAAEAAHWLVGSLNGVSWTSVGPVALALLVLGPIALLQHRDLDASALGDGVAAGLGVAVQRHRFVLLLCAVLLTAAAVSAAGPVEFVAFAAPQLALRLAGSARPPLIASALVGAVLVVGADAAGRALLPDEIPVGITTTVLGAPYLLWLLLRSRRARAVA